MPEVATDAFIASYETELGGFHPCVIRVIHFVRDERTGFRKRFKKLVQHILNGIRLTEVHVGPSKSSLSQCVLVQCVMSPRVY